MIKPNAALSGFLFCFVSITSIAQSSTKDTISPGKINFIKTNLTSIPLKNFSLQYERILNKKFSVSLTVRSMPSTTIPLQTAVLKMAGDDQNTKDIITQTKLSNVAFTPEARLYLGKGYGKGFYIAAYYRYVKFATNQVPVSYTPPLSSTRTVNLSGNLKGNTAGLMFGAQWFLGKYVCLDWWILGGHYGSGNGDFTGVPDTALTPIEQDEIRNNLNDLNIPLTHKTVTVTANKVDVKLDGPFGGVRAGISLGIRL